MLSNKACRVAQYALTTCKIAILLQRGTHILLLIYVQLVTYSYCYSAATWSYKCAVSQARPFLFRSAERFQYTARGGKGMTILLK